MTDSTTAMTLPGRRVLVPGGTGAVGEGVVRAYLEAGSDVVVPTRSERRGEELRAALGDLGGSTLLHLPTHDYTSFSGAEALRTEMQARLGGIDDVVVPVGGWWQGGALWQIGDDDWSGAFVGLATAHMALARAVVPHLSGLGAYVVVVGQSAELPVPGSGLVSMEQAAVLMMQRVLAAEAPQRRIHAFVLGPVRTRVVAGEADWVSADEVGRAAVASSGAVAMTSRTVPLGSSSQARAFVEGVAGAI